MPRSANVCPRNRVRYSLHCLNHEMHRIVGGESELPSITILQVVSW